MKVGDTVRVNKNYPEVGSQLIGQCGEITMLNPIQTKQISFQVKMGDGFDPILFENEFDLVESAPEAPICKTEILPAAPQERKKYPIGTGVISYFPDALAEVARVSWEGNCQHNPNEDLHWAKHKSQDEEDCMIRHFLQRFDDDTDGMMHAAKMAWRSLAFLQKLIEARRKNMSYQDYNKFLKQNAK